MDIIKKDGRIQKFDSNKVLTSLVNASRDSEEALLNESDLNILVEDIEKTISDLREDGSASSSYEIVGIMIDILKRDGFGSVVKSFVEHEK